MKASYFEESESNYWPLVHVVLGLNASVYRFVNRRGQDFAESVKKAIPGSTPVARVTIERY
ncbi:hypothetical protein GCM10023184_17750 [Flaviaesturariibacter amylovorans]|uniref:Uncharacterized protein n=1 Tax=Flaviaesturariibacter amylovorans TaxID=1084520 RepID=A0ABP8GQB4_9BACT